MNTELMDKWRAQRAEEASRIPLVTSGTSSEHSRACSATVPKVATPGPEHYEMATPPTAPHYFVLSSTPLPRQIERTIAQRNWAIAKSNAKSLFGEGLSADQRNPAGEKRNMRHLFGEEVEIVPSAPGLEPRHELTSEKAKNNADHLFGK